MNVFPGDNPENYEMIERVIKVFFGLLVDLKFI